MQFARKVLDVKRLSADQKQAILKAHEVGDGELGKDGQPAHLWKKADGSLASNFTNKQLKQKAAILRASFSKGQASKLMRSGTTGLYEAFNAFANVVDTVGAVQRLSSGEDRGNFGRTLGDIETAAGLYQTGAATRGIDSAMRGDTAGAIQNGIRAFGAKDNW
jgi:hypothetical protein